MKIVFIITDYGSFNNFLAEVAISLKEKGNAVSVICSNSKIINVEDKYDFHRYGIDFHYINFPRGFNIFKQFKASFSIKKVLNKLKPDVVSIHFTTAMFTTFFTGMLRFKTIGTFHGIGYPIIQGALKKIIFKKVEFYCINKLDHVWVLNEFDFNLLNETKFKNKVEQLPTKGLGCDLNKFNPLNFSSEKRKTLRRKLNIEEDDFVLVFTGRFVDFKGYNLLVKTYKHLKDNLGAQKLKLILIGDKDKLHSTGLSTDEEEWLTKENGVHNIGFTSQVNKYLSISNLFIFPSQREGMPVCIIEALAMGVPVITTNTRGCKDLIKHNKNGILLENGNSINELSHAILKFQSDSEFISQLKENIREERDSFNRQIFVHQQVDMFKKFKVT